MRVAVGGISYESSTVTKEAHVAQFPGAQRSLKQQTHPQPHIDGISWGEVDL